MNIIWGFVGGTQPTAATASIPPSSAKLSYSSAVTLLHSGCRKVAKITLLRDPFSECDQHIDVKTAKIP